MDHVNLCALTLSHARSFHNTYNIGTWGLAQRLWGYDHLLHRRL